MSLTPENLASLPLEDRLLRFYELSEEAFERASRATADAERDSFLALAFSWRSLATEAEELLRAQRGK
jgi:hypothetical protein